MTFCLSACLVTFQSSWMRARITGLWSRHSRRHVTRGEVDAVTALSWMSALQPMQAGPLMSDALTRT